MHIINATPNAKRKMCSACASARNCVHAACVCVNIATRQSSCDILIFESAANCFSFAPAEVNESTDSHHQKYTTHRSVLSEPAPHLVKACLPAYLSLSLCSEGKQTRLRYTHLQKHLAAWALIPFRLVLKSRSQVNRGESHVLFVSQHFWPSVSVKADFFFFLHNAAYGQAFLNRPEKCQGRACDRFTWDDPSPHECDLPDGCSCGFYTSYNNVTWPAVHLRLNLQLNALQWSLKRWLLAAPCFSNVVMHMGSNIGVPFVRGKKCKFNLKTIPSCGQT